MILELRDQKVQQALLDAELELKAVEADLASLKVRLNNELLQQQSDAANIQAMYHKAKIQAEANELLLKDGLISPVITRISQVEAAELENRSKIEQEKLKIKANSIDAQVNAEQARVSQKEALYNLRKSEADALKVRAGIEGVLQIVPVQVGQRVPAGTNLARVAVPGRLKAELRIPETQARDIEIGQKATVDTRNGEVEGRVARIDPAAQNGTVRRGRRVHAAAASRRPAGPERGRHRGTRAAGKRPLRRTSGVRAGTGDGQPLQGHAGHLRSAGRGRADHREAGAQLGEHGGDPGRA